MSQYFPKPYEPFEGDINAKVDLCHYATKTDLKNVSHVDSSSFALKSNLTSLKTEVGKLDIDKLVPVHVDLSKVSDVIKNDVVKTTEYGKLVAKVNNIDTTGFVLKTTCDTDKSDLERKLVMQIRKLLIQVIWLKKTDLNAKTTETESKIPSITGLATNSGLTDVCSLVKKTDYDKKVSEIEKNLLVIIMTNTLLLQNLII